MANVLFYDKYKNPITYNLGNIYNHGGCGKIYKLDDDTCLKYFSEDNYYDETAVKKIISLNLPSFYKIYKLLYDEDNNFIGYTMKYYEDMEIDILTMPVEYTTYNLYKLYKDINKLIESKIYIIDLTESNTIINNNDITVIDIDLYKYRENAKKIDLYNHNIIELYNMFSEMYFNALLTFNHDIFCYDKVIIDELFSPNMNPQIITKKLAKYKYPIDYMKAMR